LWRIEKQIGKMYEKPFPAVTEIPSLTEA
jgi:hypothetical protein